MNYSQIAEFIRSNVHPGMKTKWGFTLVLCTAIMFGVFLLNHVWAEDYPLVITVENNSGFEDTQVYLLVIALSAYNDWTLAKR